MLWWYSLALTLSGATLGAICFVFPHWDMAWSAAYLAELFVFLSIPLWLIVFVRWLMGK
ncbi:MAG: hypothetical protein ORN27_07850 [Rhodoluna sp.]|jgi:hypothetical protein|nr:hypothetical protein [Rhodoluna sp.]